ncbi:hypothetical protein EST38_g425 [Candolleomyces aberdarensis]|uniref:Nephrocystin 3-like N-terminal domain-containing protein n=1 Tax=Candolleomyces aberdarensis TaxID=2316362 RepID=A0A4V1Q5G0_9AGAR|nr:hypothetical protein EST38_g425 [Candolleomyces aberdarensis]
MRRRNRVRALAQSPFLIVLDGLDECDNKDEVQELIDGMLLFFNENPFIPIRVFITSRVEQYIQSRLDVPGVHLENLVDHCSDDDIATFLQVMFEDGCRRDPVVKAYVQQHGMWPTPDDRCNLVKHIGGSFIFASEVFKFIMGSNTMRDQRTTPMDRLPLALKMNPGLDNLYEQTLGRSEHLPHFTAIISTTALSADPLSISDIADVLGINIYEVVKVLVNLQAIIQVPGTDDIPVTLCHTSLRDFLTTQSRSSRFFVHLSHHVTLFRRWLEGPFISRPRRSDSLISSVELPPVVLYGLRCSLEQWYLWFPRVSVSEAHSAIQLCREALRLYPDAPKLIDGLANAIYNCAKHIAESAVDLEEAIPLYREALRLRPSPHPDRSTSLTSLGSILIYHYRCSGTVADLEEAICLYREALPLFPSPHPFRSFSLFKFGNALRDRYRCTESVPDLEEAISLYREALGFEPFYPDHATILTVLVVSLRYMYKHSRELSHLQEAIARCKDLLKSRFVRDKDRVECLLRSISLQMNVDATGQEEDPAHIAGLEEEVNLLLASVS